MKPHQGLLLLLTAIVSGQPFSVMAQEVAPAQSPLDFNRDIRPILSENCFYCHGQDSNKRLADLRLDDRDAAIAAGAIVPGDASASGLIQRIHSENPDEQMPPPKSNRRLSPEQKALLQRWITEGAVYQKHWAFVAPVRPADPEVTRTGLVAKLHRSLCVGETGKRWAAAIAGSRSSDIDPSAFDRSDWPSSQA
jgi:hypothetical protein